VVGTLAKSSTSQPDKPEPLEWDQTQNVHIFIGNFFICLVRFLLSLLLSLLLLRYLGLTDDIIIQPSRRKRQKKPEKIKIKKTRK
jgi:hypothetical protein